MALEISMTLYSRKPCNNVRDINILDSNHKQSINTTYRANFPLSNIISKELKHSYNHEHELLVIAVYLGMQNISNLCHMIMRYQQLLQISDILHIIT